MRKFFKPVACMLFIIGIGTSVNSPLAKAQPGGRVSFEVFYDNLSPYGAWVHDPVYGYVWIPDAGPDFRPYYTGGHWVMTEYGNTWVSDYNWGWAPFHYGRWTYDGYYGWVWVPDYEWGPSWVSWRWSGNYCGWAPMRPGIYLSVGYVNYSPPYDWWVFIPPTYIHHHHFHQYYRGPNYNTTIIHNTTIINNTYVNNNVTYISGPRKNDIENVSHKPVTVYQVRNETKPGKMLINNNEVNIYRPEIKKGATEHHPKNVIKEDHPIGEPQPVSANGGKPLRSTDKKQNSSNTTPIRVEPGKAPSPGTEKGKALPPGRTNTVPKETPDRTKIAPGNPDKNPSHVQPPVQKQIPPEQNRNEDQKANQQTPEPGQPQKESPPTIRPDVPPTDRSKEQRSPDVQQQPKDAPQNLQPRQTRKAERMERKRNQRGPH